MDKQIIGKGFEATTELVKRYVHEKKVAGAAAYVAKGGQVLHRQYEGYANLTERTPIADDTIYRIFSMSKVVTCVAVLQLYERGLFAMYDPVERFLPDLRNQRVFQGEKIVPAERPVTMRDLFTMTSGFPYPGDSTPTGIAYMQALQGVPPEHVFRELMKSIGETPLAFQPGAQWMYGLSIDILGAVLQAITGMTLGDYLKENITGPLGMADTGFYLTPGQLPRLSELYMDQQGKFVPAAVGEGVLDRDACERPSFESGGGGLFSTLDDYARFAQMLLCGGTLEGVKILGRKTVDLMRTNHLTPKQRETDNWPTQRGYGYGLGVRVRVENDVAGSNGSVGEWGWDGMAGTWFCVDPVEDMIALFMVQRVPGDHHALIPPFMATVYGAL